MTYKPWTDEENGFILDTLGWPIRRVAEQLDRTPHSVQQRRTDLVNGKAMEPKTPPWTAAEEAVIVANPFLSVRDIAVILNRSPEAVKIRRSAIRRSANPSVEAKNLNPHKNGSRPLLAKTCIGCGLLLQAKWFTGNHKGWSKTCTRCQPRGRSPQAYPDRSREFMRRMQELTLPLATSNNQQWTLADHEVLASQDMTILEKALRLGRTYMATASMCRSSGHKSLVGLGDPERDQWIIDNPNAIKYQPEKAA